MSGKNMVRYKLIVQKSPKCIMLLEYLDKNIVTINRLGASVRVEKINSETMDDQLLESFRRRGIVSLPVLIGPDGSKIVGCKAAISMFERNIKEAKSQQMTDALGSGPEYRAEMGTNPDLTSFYARELFSGVDEHGRAVPRKDKDEAEDEDIGASYSRRMADYNRNRPKSQQPAEDTRDDEPRRRRADPYDDNVADTPTPTHVDPRRTEEYVPSSGDPGADEMDRRIMATLMNNID